MRELSWWEKVPGYGVIAACPSHGQLLAAVGFVPGHLSCPDLGPPPQCPMCAGLTSFDDVRACRCERSPFRCPVHGAPMRHVEPVDTDEHPASAELLTVCAELSPALATWAALGPPSGVTTDRDWPWARWRDRARAAGLSEELAELGAQVMREAVSHVWRRTLLVECGVQDGGAQMIASALAYPTWAAERWTYLLETDGERGYRVGHTWEHHGA